MSWLLWIAAAIAFLVIEIFTGTFFCAAIACSCLVAAAIAFFAQPLLLWQIGAASACAIAACMVLGRIRKRPSGSGGDGGSFDVGKSVTVDHWSEDGRASVRYRGTIWEAALKEGCPPKAGACRIAGLDANVLILEPLNEPLNQ